MPNECPTGLPSELHLVGEGSRGQGEARLQVASTSADEREKEPRGTQ